MMNKYEKDRTRSKDAAGGEVGRPGESDGGTGNGGITVGADAELETARSL